MRLAYFDCPAGAAGDMMVAALLDAGLDADQLREQLASLPLDLPPIDIKRVQRRGIAATYFHPHPVEETTGRHLSDIVELIGSADGLSARAKALAVAVFERLARAEAAVHDTDVDHVHFHEVGAVDSIIDIVSACIGLDVLGIDQVVCSPVAVGGGTVTCDHGTLPVPAPATLRLLQEAQVPFRGGPVECELLTPTAAAILAEVADGFGSMPAMTVQAVGYGAGTRELEALPNVVRLVLGSEVSESVSVEPQTVVVLECNLDDADGELVGHAVETLLAAGALDVWTTPIGMKNSRPGVQLSVLCEPLGAEALQQWIFEQGLTLGLRRRVVHRQVLGRKTVTVETAYGDIRIKLGYLGGRRVSAKPEYADCAAAAKTHGVSLRMVRHAALDAMELGRAELDAGESD